jgi:hypothetical protein
MTTQQDQQETPFTCYFVIARELMAEIVMKKGRRLIHGTGS